MRNMMYGLSLIFIVGVVLYALDIQRDALTRLIFLINSSIPYLFAGAVLGLLDNIRRNNSRKLLLLAEILKNLEND